MKIFKEFITKKNITILGGFLSVLTLIIFLYQSNPSSVVVSDTGWKVKTERKEKANKTDGSKSEMQQVKRKSMVDVKGEVMSPGVYEFLEGDRVMDIIKQAGGFTSQADSKQVNLAEVVEDSSIIYIPKIGEIEEEVLVANSVEQASRDGKGSATANGKLNINLASVSDFLTLPGVGQTRAEAIVQKRTELGKFQSTEDLMQVSGIGQKTFEKLKELITVK